MEENKNTTDAFLFLKGSRAKPDQPDTSKIPSSSSVPVTDKDSDYYNMNHSKRGIAVIFNHHTFNNYSLGRRDGTMKDCKDLEMVLTHLKFDVKVYDDLQYGSVLEVIDDLSKADHSDSDCLLITVLSHGEAGRVYARDRHYSPDMLWKAFSGDKCVSLVGKPKLFFIQACRGDEVDHGVSVRSLIQTDAISSNKYTIPVMSDILVMYSTYDGFYSWRSPVSGSWFIQCLCKELTKRARERDLVTILTFLNRRMAIDYKSNVPGDKKMDAKKQIGTIVSTLTRLLYFYGNIK